MVKLELPVWDNDFCAKFDQSPFHLRLAIGREGLKRCHLPKGEAVWTTLVVLVVQRWGTDVLVGCTQLPRKRYYIARSRNQ